MTSSQQTDLFRLDWLPIGEAAKLCGLDERWLTNELLAGRLKGISVKIAIGGVDPGLEVWMPSVGVWMLSHRELEVPSMAILRTPASSVGSGTTSGGSR